MGKGPNHDGGQAYRVRHGRGRLRQPVQQCIQQREPCWIQDQPDRPRGAVYRRGVQALQHITLSNDADGKTIVVGSCNNVEKTAELRSYEQVNQQYAQRYGGQAFPVEQQVYDELVKKLSEFFSNQSLQVVIIKPPVGQPPGPAALKTGSSAGLIIVLVILALIVAAGLIYYFGFYESS